MPGFIRNKSDEARWGRAKTAANKTLSEGDGDSYWALTNSIYQKMTKEEGLEKAKHLSDEYDPNVDPTESEDDLGEGYHEFDPNDEESAGEDWLKENDPEHQAKGSEYEEYGPDEDEVSHQQSIDEDYGSEDPNHIPATSQSEEPKSSGRFMQPSREDLMAMRQYTRPWEQRAREAQALKADPSKNPMLARHGNIIEARNAAHGDRNAAYRAFTGSKEYKDADPIAQMEMDDNFEREWKAKNPEHLKNALAAHGEAHEKGKSAKDIHAAAKDAQIKNIISGGGHGGEGYSLEEGMQHAGGVKGEAGTEASIKQDPATSFAMGNQDFIKQYGQDYNKKAKKVGNIDEMVDYDEGSKRDVNRILGGGPSKDPKFEKFFSHYYPLIGMSARKTLSKLGLDPKHPDIDMSMLHEAGMHGLIQAMNDYDHENPTKANFATHAGNKIRGLQMTAMKNQDQIPTEIRQAQKKFAAQGEQPKPKVDLHSMISQSGHPKAADIGDRLKRVGTQRQAQTIRRSAVASQPKPISQPVIPKMETEEE